MHEGIYIAASAGLKQGKKMEVIAQNLANVNSTGYKKDRLAFKELMPPFPPDAGNEASKNALLTPDKSNKNVSYVAVTDQYTDHKPGIFKQTNSEMDMALDGPGYFSVLTTEGIRYTRNGNFRLDTENRLVNQSEQPVLNEQGEPIVINAQGSDISIDANGNIFAGSGIGNQNIGKIKLVDFENNEDLKKKININTAAIAYVEATFLENKIDFNKIVSIANKNDIPVIVDASAKLPPVENLYKFYKGGASLVSFSGGKGVRGPQNTGFMIGKKEYVQLARKNLICFNDTKSKIGRPMKVSKECIVGLLTALKLFLDTDQKAVWAEWKKKAKYVVDELGKIDGIKIALEDESTIREGPQVIFYFSDNWRGISPSKLKKDLENGDPSIFLGDGGYGADMNISMVNVRDGEEKIIADKLKRLLII